MCRPVRGDLQIEKFEAYSIRLLVRRLLCVKVYAVFKGYFFLDRLDYNADGKTGR